MKNVTLSADDRLIDRARETARARHTTLNAAFREWLIQYTSQLDRMRRFDEAMERTRYVKVDRKFTREEMNER